MRRWGSAVVGFAGMSTAQDLLAPLRVEQVYTREERLRSGAGRGLQHWAGRLAAKYAVLRLLDLPATAEHLGAVEIVPRPSAMCAHTAACLHGHPPTVRLSAALTGGADHDWTAEAVRVSVTHAADMAFAVALLSARLPEDDTEYGETA